MRVGLIYNQPVPSLYDKAGESAAEVSIWGTVFAVEQALLQRGCRVATYPLVPPFGNAVNTVNKLEADVIFNLFEGFSMQQNSESEMASALAATGIPYTGSPSAALALTLDKSATHCVLEAAGLKVPAHQTLDLTSLDNFNLRFPCIVKPLAEDASHAISEKSVVINNAELQEAVAMLNERYPHTEALIEEFMDGREFNVTVLGNGNPRLLAVSEIDYSLSPGLPRLLTFEAKWQPESEYYRQTKVTCPAVMESGLAGRLESAALAAFRVTGCRGYARIDFRLDGQGCPVILEVNANPDLSGNAGVALQAAVAGMPYEILIDTIVCLAMEAP